VQLATDGTSPRQPSIKNAIDGIPTKGGYKMITLLPGILAENNTTECLTGSIVHMFKE
jgi:hypothetical protein